MDVGHLFLAIVAVAAFPAGCWFIERYPTEPADPKAPGGTDVSPAPDPRFVPTRPAGWLTTLMATYHEHQARLRDLAHVELQSAARGPAPTGLPRRKARRTR